jgi:hypothetical protein
MPRGPKGRLIAFRKRLGDHLFERQHPSLSPGRVERLGVDQLPGGGKSALVKGAPGRPRDLHPHLLAQRLRGAEEAGGALRVPPTRGHAGQPADSEDYGPGVAQGFNRVIGPENTSVDIGTSRVERAVGGSFHDTLEGGSAKNTYKGGPGGSDSFYDFGGREADATFPAVAASDDTYMGFTSGTGHDRVVDCGGAADRLDLRPLESSDVYFDAYDWDVNGPTIP